MPKFSAMVLTNETLAPHMNGAIKPMSVAPATDLGLIMIQKQQDDLEDDHHILEVKEKTKNSQRILKNPKLFQAGIQWRKGRDSNPRYG